MIIIYKRKYCIILSGIILGLTSFIIYFTPDELKTYVGKYQNQTHGQGQERQPAQSPLPSVQLGALLTIDTRYFISVQSDSDNDAYLCPDSITTDPANNYIKGDAYEIVKLEPIFLDIPLSEDLQLYTIKLSEEFNVPYDLLFAIMFVESTFRPHVISGTNDYGLMQINRVNHGWLREQHGISNFLCAQQNILSGTIMISALIEQYGDLHRALMAYNMGSAGARRRWNQGIYTSSYSERVIEVMNNYIQQREQIKLKEVNESIEYC
jgi:soluble lytic murein transglycosylase-like protein